MDAQEYFFSDPFVQMHFKEAEPDLAIIQKDNKFFWTWVESLSKYENPVLRGPFPTKEAAMLDARSSIPSKFYLLWNGIDDNIHSYGPYPDEEHLIKAATVAENHVAHVKMYSAEISIFGQMVLTELNL